MKVNELLQEDIQLPLLDHLKINSPKNSKAILEALVQKKDIPFFRSWADGIKFVNKKDFPEPKKLIRWTSQRTRPRRSVTNTQLFLNFTLNWKNVPARNHSIFCATNSVTEEFWKGYDFPNVTLIIPNDNVKMSLIPKDFNELTINPNKKNSESWYTFFSYLESILTMLDLKNTTNVIDYIDDIQKYINDSENDATLRSSYLISRVNRCLKEAKVKTVSELLSKLTPEKIGLKIFENANDLISSKSEFDTEEMWFDGQYTIINITQVSLPQLKKMYNML